MLANPGGWITDLKEKVKADCQIILIANKIDIADQVVAHEEGRKLAEEFNVPFFECSAKTGQNVSQAFEALVHLMKDYIVDQKEALPKDRGTVTLQDTKTPTKTSGGKCSC